MDNTDLLGVEPTAEPKAAAKKPKKAAEEPADDAASAVLAAAMAEGDTVLAAHIIRQQNHHNDLAPSIAKKARDDLEREAMLNEQGRIAAEWNAKLEAERKAQAEREERETAAARIADLETEVAGHKAAIDEKTAEIKRLQKLVKE